MRVWLVAMALALLVGGCATVENSLTVAEVASLRIDKVDIAYAPEARIWWGRAEREYVEQMEAKQPAKARRVNTTNDDATTAASDHAKVVESPEAQAAIRNRLSGMVKKAVDEQVRPNFKGARPAVLEVRIISFVIPSPAQRILLGGSPTLGAVTVLKDAKTGVVLASSDRMAAGMAGNGLIGVAVDQGFSDLEDRVVNAYAANVNAWLAKK